MRVFIAGATGVIGRLRVPRLIAAGDEAHGMTRSVSKRAMPWSGSDYAHQPAAAPHGPGAVRRLRYRKRRTVTIEPVVEMHAGRCLVYEVISGLPVRHYRATVELTPDRTAPTSSGAPASTAHSAAACSAGPCSVSTRRW